MSGTSRTSCMGRKKICRFRGENMCKNMHRPGDSAAMTFLSPPVGGHKQPVKWSLNITIPNRSPAELLGVHIPHFKREAYMGREGTAKHVEKPPMFWCFTKMGNLPRNTKLKKPQEHGKKITTFFVQGLFYFGLWLLGA